MKENGIFYQQREIFLQHSRQQAIGRFQTIKNPGKVYSPDFYRYKHHYLSVSSSFIVPAFWAYLEEAFFA